MAHDVEEVSESRTQELRDLVFKLVSNEAGKGIKAPHPALVRESNKGPHGFPTLFPRVSVTLHGEELDEDEKTLGANWVFAVAVKSERAALPSVSAWKQSEPRPRSDKLGHALLRALIAIRDAEESNTKGGANDAKD